MNNYERVREFHKVMGQPAPDTFTKLDDERLELRWNLIHEEYLEVSEAIDDVKDNPTDENYAKLFKELSDLIYVAHGAQVEAGFDGNAGFEEVCRSNMSKLGADGKPIYRADGKVLKGENYSPADLNPLISRAEVV